MRLSMWFFSFLCIAIGLFPDALYSILPFETEYQPYTIDHLVSQSQLLLFSGLAFFAMLPMMKRSLTISLDFDWFYRRFGRILADEFTIRSSHAFERMERRTRLQVEGFVRRLYRHHGPHGILARTWPSGGMVLWVTVMLAGMVIAAAIL